MQLVQQVVRNIRRLGEAEAVLVQKNHAKVDAFGMPLDFVLTGGEAHELTVAKELLGIDISGYLLADGAYDSNDFRDFLAGRGTEAVIPCKKNRIIPIEHDRHIYKERNFVERFFNRLKQFRRVATRYEKLAVTFMGAIVMASILMWLKF